MLFLLIDFPQKLKFGKTHGILTTLFYVSFFFSWATKDMLSSQKNQINSSSSSNCWGYPKFRLKRISEPPH